MNLPNLKNYSALVIPVLLIYTFLLSFLNYEVPTALWVLDLSLVLVSFSIYVFQKSMVSYVLRRIRGAIVTIFIISSFVFLMLRVLPGGPFDQEKVLPPEVKANIEAKYNLDAPLHEQFFNYIVGLVQGDLGESYKYLGRDVSDIISESLPASLELGIYSLILAFIIGIPTGVIAASKHNTIIDNVAMFGAIGFVALPNFVVAAFLIVLFVYWIPIFPPGFWEGTSSYILPVIVLGTRPAASIARLTRSSVLDVISSDYIRTARSKGLSDWSILFKHVLKNSLIPVLTFSGPLVAGILSGAFVVEMIFAIPGIGKHFIQSVGNRDYPLILGLTLFYSVLLIVANLIVDLLYSYFDPRIKLK